LSTLGSSGLAGLFSWGGIDFGISESPETTYGESWTWVLFTAISYVSVLFGMFFVISLFQAV